MHHVVHYEMHYGMHHADGGGDGHAPGRPRHHRRAGHRHSHGVPAQDGARLGPLHARRDAITRCVAWCIAQCIPWCILWCIPWCVAWCIAQCIPWCIPWRHNESTIVRRVRATRAQRPHAPDAPQRPSRSATLLCPNAARASRASCPSSSTCSTHSRPSPSARSGATARRGGARSATATWPSARCAPRCRLSRSSRTWCAPSHHTAATVCIQGCNRMHPRLQPYVSQIRAESLITESCGSSSMASVCSCCLAVRHAGLQPLPVVAARVPHSLRLYSHV